MKIAFKIPNGSTLYKYPTDPEDITFSEFTGYLDKVYSKAPQIIKDIDKAVDEGDSEKAQELAASIDDEVLAKQMYPYFARVVSYFTKVSYSVLVGMDGQGINVQQLEGLYYQILRALTPPPADQYEYQKEFDFLGNVWVIPDRLMAHASVIEFAEAAQFQASMKEVENGQFRALIDVCAVLLRKKGEAYSDNIYKRNKRLFQDLPLSVVWQVAFFLMRQSMKLSNNFRIYTAALGLSRLKRELSNLQTTTDGI
jgi:hypothetical protein